jgi:hypothetical protein
LSHVALPHAVVPVVEPPLDEDPLGEPDEDPLPDEELELNWFVASPESSSTDPFSDLPPSARHESRLADVQRAACPAGRECARTDAAGNEESP